MYLEVHVWPVVWPPADDASACEQDDEDQPAECFSSGQLDIQWRNDERLYKVKP